MSRGNFIIYTLIYIAIATFLTFKAGPNIFKDGKSINTTPTEFTNVERIDFWYHKVGKQYLNVKIIANSTPIEFQIYLPEGKYKTFLVC
ncbi:hypothetical protein [Tenacibaculum sp. IB213877]|uniref:hypothetical protein n=1 Tax=Tenacibaculum sp. IB213877 TaxID=3097351 RepID=UPI002A59D92E|nr:hypothetical protein [Tenacibaculum sp. IB213877]MDY0781348.1 hypothetical protein [Tenacibaculum sp. IB213877]